MRSPWIRSKFRKSAWTGRRWAKAAATCRPRSPTGRASPCWGRRARRGGGTSRAARSRSCWSREPLERKAKFNYYIWKGNGHPLMTSHQCCWSLQLKSIGRLFHDAHNGLRDALKTTLKVWYYCYISQEWNFRYLRLN